MRDAAQTGTGDDGFKSSLRRIAWATSLAVSLASGAWSAPAAACGATPPSWTLLAEEGKVFASTRALKLYQYGFPVLPAETRVTLRALSPGDAGAPIALALRATEAAWLFEADLGGARLSEGTRYALTLDIDGDEGWSGVHATLEFDAVATPAEPSALGSLRLEKREAGQLAWGGCGYGREGVQAVIALDPTPAAVGWARAAKHQLLVDGQVAQQPELQMVDYVAFEKSLRVRAMAFCAAEGLGMGTGGIGAGRDAIDVEMQPGEHSLVWRSVFPSGQELITAALEVDLRCGSGPGGDVDGGTAAVASGGDAGAPLPSSGDGSQASSGSGSAPDRGGLDPSAEPADTSGCTLTSQRPAAAAVVTWAWFGLMLCRVLRARSRRPHGGIPRASVDACSLSVNILRGLTSRHERCARRSRQL